MGVELRPCLKAFIFALIPGLEEEGNEFFDEILILLIGLRDMTGPEYFYPALWMGMMLMPRHRLAVVNFLTKAMPKVDSASEFSVLTGGHSDVFVCAWSAALSDENVLVQRGLLDLIVVHVPLSKSFLKTKELEKLTEAVLGVVLRKEMSLNRRLYAWLLGNSDGAEDQRTYYETHAQAVLTNTLRNALHRPSDDSQDWMRPLRILISLLDKIEIGGPLVDALYIDVLQQAFTNVVRNKTSETEVRALYEYSTKYSWM